MKKVVNIITEHKKEISKEKTRALGGKIQSPSLLEQAASKWKKKKELEERQVQKEIIEKNEHLQISPGETLPKEGVNYNKRKLFSPQVVDSNENSWVQYIPLDKKENKEEKQISINTATVIKIRKKMIADEWARALGNRRQNTNLCNLEQQAVVYSQRREEKNKEEKKEKIRCEQHKKAVNKILAEFSNKLRDKKVAENPEKLSDLFQISLENAGEVFNVEWQEKKCIIWMETWTEKKIRRIAELTIPKIYKIEINENLEIASCKKVENEKALKKLRVETLNKFFSKHLEEISFDINNEKNTKEFLEDTLCEVGSLINLKHSGNKWLATIEFWDNMRKRNVKRKEKSPIITEQIQFINKDGKLKIVL